MTITLITGANKGVGYETETPEAGAGRFIHRLSTSEW